MKANRLDMLIYQIDLELKQATAEVEQLINSQLIGRGYDEIERQAGILGDTVTRNMQIDVETIAHASFHSAKWSDRVWKNNNEVRAKISNAMRQYVVQGIPTSKALKALEKMVKSNVSNASYAARRIIVTERQRVAAEVQTKIYEEAGVKWIKFITEPGCCEICRDLDGKVFKIEDAEAGSNMRPIHPNCRCSTTMANAPYEETGDPFDEWLETC